MRRRARAIAGRGLERILVRAGYTGPELALARSDTWDWARARARSVKRRRGLVGGVEVVVTAPGRAELRPVERVLAGPGELTVELLASALSPGTERAQWLRLPNAQPELPYAPGYSGAGRVLAAGDGAQFAPGTEVAVVRVPHTSVATVAADWAVAVPDGVPAARAALVYLAVIAGYGVRRAGLEPGRSVCVVGAGPIGALAHRLVAAGHEPGELTVVARSRRAEAAALRTPGTRFRTADEAGDLQADVVIEATGDPAGLVTAAAAAGPGATVVLLGSPRGPSPARVLGEVQRRRLRLVGAHISALAVEAREAGADPFRELATAYLKALAAGRLEVDDLVGEAADPREIGLLYRRLAAGTVDAAHLDWRLLPEGERIRPRPLLSAPALPPSRPRVGRAGPGDPPAAARTLRVAAVGCGDIGWINARAVERAANARLALVHDGVEALAERVAAEVGGSVARTLEEALDPERVDAVLLSVPHDLHGPLAAQAAEAGLHVIAEKPLAHDLPSARAAAAAASRAGVALTVLFPFRYEPAALAARSLVEAGALGAPAGASVLFHADKPAAYWVGGFSGRARSDWRGSRARAGGGVLIMNVTHYVDLLRHLAGLEPVRVAATARVREGAEVEEEIALTIDFAGGAVGSILASAATPGAPASRFELWGDLGSVRLEPEPAVYTERAVDGATPGRWCALPEAPAGDPRAAFVDAFCTAVADGRAPDVTPADALAVQAFVAAAYRSAFEEGGAPVALEAAEG